MSKLTHITFNRKLIIIFSLFSSDVYYWYSYWYYMILFHIIWYKIIVYDTILLLIRIVNYWLHIYTLLIILIQFCSAPETTIVRATILILIQLEGQLLLFFFIELTEYNFCIKRYEMSKWVGKASAKNEIVPKNKVEFNI